MLVDMSEYEYEIEDHIARILYPEQEIQGRVRELANQVDQRLHAEMSEEDIWERPPIAVCILRGAAVFMADLTRNMEVPIEYDFMAISSYRDAAEPGEVRLIKDLDRSINGRTVLIVEDIIDTGETLKHIMRGLEARNPRSIKICTLINKVSRRKADLSVDFSGFNLKEDLFIVGYGMDYAGRYRNLPFIGALKEEWIDQ